MDTAVILAVAPTWKAQNPAMLDGFVYHEGTEVVTDNEVRIVYRTGRKAQYLRYIGFNIVPSVLYPGTYRVAVWKAESNTSNILEAYIKEGVTLPNLTLEYLLFPDFTTEW